MQTICDLKLKFVERLDIRIQNTAVKVLFLKNETLEENKDGEDAD